LSPILGWELQRTLKSGAALLVFAALFMGLAGDLTFARVDAAEAGSATSANEVTGQGHAEQGSEPAATAEAEEHGLPQKAVEIARPFGFPITTRWW